MLVNWQYTAANIGYPSDMPVLSLYSEEINRCVCPGVVCPFQ